MNVAGWRQAMKGTFIDPGDDPAEKLPRIGLTLGHAITFHEKARDQFKTLWKMYLLDCKAHGIKPIASPWAEEREGGGKREESPGRAASDAPKSDHPVLGGPTDA